MGTDGKATYCGGRNIAMKIPPDTWAQTVVFYRDVLGFKVVERVSTEPLSICFEFGENRLWLDKTDGLDRAEIWLELTTDNVEAAAAHFKSAGVKRRDDVEALPEDFEGFWIQNPASVIHLVEGRRRKVISGGPPGREHGQ